MAERGRVYRIKRMGPRTDPWGTPYSRTVGRDFGAIDRDNSSSVRQVGAKPSEREQC